MLALGHRVCGGFWHWGGVCVCSYMQSNSVNGAGAWGLCCGLCAGSPGLSSPCRAPGSPATSRRCYRGCHLGFLLRQAGWRNAGHQEQLPGASSASRCPRGSVVAGQNQPSQQQPDKPALCAQELNLPSLIEDLHNSARAVGIHERRPSPALLRAAPALCCWLRAVLRDALAWTFGTVSPSMSFCNPWR